MKKALTIVSIIASSVSYTMAQIGVAATQGTVNANALFQLLDVVQKFVARLVPLAVGLAVLAFFWFLIKFIWKGGSSGDEKKSAVSGMGYSVLAIFLMVSIWGVIGLLGSMFGINQGGNIPVPTVPLP